MHDTIEKSKMKKIIYFLAIIAGIAIICTSCLLSKILKYTNYNDEISQNLPETFRVELPLDIDSANFFWIRAKINKQHDMDFIIDTAADDLARSQDLKNLNATFWGKYPLPVGLTSFLLMKSIQKKTEKIYI